VTKIERTAFINGKIYTVDPKNLWADTIIVEGNKISFVGSFNDAEELITNECRVIDLKGKLVLPGFIESHAHIAIGGNYLLGVDLEKSKNKKQFIDTLKDYVLESPANWIKGGNWNHENWDKIELPDKNWVDEFSKDTPILVHRLDYHMALANSCALRLANISKDTVDPPGGKIERDKLTGEPTGILKDKAINLVSKIIQKQSKQEIDKACLTALNEAAKFGITSIQDITLEDDLNSIRRIESEGDLNCRIYARLPIEFEKEKIQKFVKDIPPDSKIKLRSVKAFADGSLGSSTALFFEPYTDEPDNNGLAMEYVNTGELEKLSKYFDREKFQLSIHAIGDKAVSDTINMFERIAVDNPNWDRRFRIEHAQHIKTKDIARIAKLGIIVSAQPYHLYCDGVWAEKKIGEERLKEFLPFKSFMDKKVKLCFGSDYPVVNLNPLKGIYAAVTRATENNKYPNGLTPKEKISVEDAVKAYTIDAAFAAFEEDEKGSLEVSKLADFVVLEKDIFEIPKHEIADVKVEMTVFDGKIIYEQDKLNPV
jgi:predicted amidohydrolase YtcJ